MGKRDVRISAATYSMNNILIWISMNNDSQAKQRFRGLLWGYPDLVKELFEKLGPALVEARETRRERKGAKEEKNTTENVNNLNVPEVMAKVEITQVEAERDSSQ